MFNWNICNTHISWIRKNTIGLVRSGSHAYGTNIFTSDEDYKGICVPPFEYFFGFLHNFEQLELKNPDITIFNIVKFFKLATDCNPNILEILWTDREDIIETTDVFELLIKNRDLFLSQKVKHTFSGYAIAQLKRIQIHKKWLMHPPDHEPNRKEFGLSENVSITNSSFGLMKSLEDENSLYNYLNKELIIIFNKENEYRNAVKYWKQYNNWKDNRNKERFLLEEKYGYDLKHAMHLVRLIRMCKEILSGKGVLVKRPDAEELLSIRNGAWTYEQILDFVDKEEIEIEKLLLKTSLPHDPDRKKLDKLCIEIVSKYFNL